MFGLFEKKRKNVIGDRIKALNDRLWLIQMTDKNDSIKTRVRYPKNDEIEMSETYRIFSFDTDFGKREIALNNSSLYYGDESMIQENKSKEGYGWSFDFNYLFKIKVKDEDVFVDFTPDLTMSKEEIDLAILEFENKIDALYKEITERQKAHENLVSYLKEGC